MLVTFQSTAAPDVVMSKSLTHYLLGIIGKHTALYGVVTTDELPGAIAALESAIRDESVGKSPLDGLHHAPHGHDDDGRDGLRQRAVPLLDMLKAAESAGADIVWGL